ncbi:HNH endonuclease [Oceanobacillus caeni]|uniref:HNH endonuclease signature motif containing protein n=1 Tax=Oceanobacillus caeni TaxID=405946 RepID=UPI00214A40B8|nr:HNH endonuclease signature motif containing protein [Oceanobacillus caeni]MCR1833101.1 HNH endonuclease [Oceanobacillus caeni]
MSDEFFIKYIKENFVYHPNGKLTRTDRKNSNGSYDKDGYLIIKIKGKQFKAHRIVYAMHYGYFPDGELDHINRVRDDNRIENLRLATRKENTLNTNRKPNEQTGVVGVYIDKTKGLKKKYATKLGGKSHRFYSLDEALEMRKRYYKDSKEFLKHG